MPLKINKLGLHRSVIDNSLYYKRTSHKFDINGDWLLVCTTRWLCDTFTIVSDRKQALRHNILEKPRCAWSDAIIRICRWVINERDQTAQSRRAPIENGRRRDICQNEQIDYSASIVHLDRRIGCVWCSTWHRRYKAPLRRDRHLVYRASRNIWG